jgi:hypothetical protein
MPQAFYSSTLSFWHRFCSALWLLISDWEVLLCDCCYPNIVMDLDHGDEIFGVDFNKFLDESSFQGVHDASAHRPRDDPNQLDLICACIESLPYGDTIRLLDCIKRAGNCPPTFHGRTHSTQGCSRAMMNLMTISAAQSWLGVDSPLTAILVQPSCDLRP